jgi:hypothetical protein
MAERPLSRRALLTSVFGVGGAAGTLVHAQTAGRSDTDVLSGSDIGFQVERTDRDGAKVGRLVVRSEGKWVDARFSFGVHRGISQ